VPHGGQQDGSLFLEKWGFNSQQTLFKLVTSNILHKRCESETRTLMRKQKTFCQEAEMRGILASDAVGWLPLDWPPPWLVPKAATRMPKRGGGASVACRPPTPLCPRLLRSWINQFHEFLLSVAGSGPLSPPFKVIVAVARPSVAAAL
jgi:hypothetical protein